MVGILTSEYLGLGETDADARWIGIRRHQAVLIVAGVGIAGDGVIAQHHTLLEVALGVAAVIGAAPIIDGLTVSLFIVVCCRFMGRRRWNTIECFDDGTSMEIHARGVAHVMGFELNHRGRLDLSGSDVEMSDRLAALVVGLSARGSSSHVSLHVRSGEHQASTMLALERHVSHQEGWTQNRSMLEAFIGANADGQASGFLERWTYIRQASGLARVLRVVDFNAASSSLAIFERVQMNGRRPAIALHIDVLAGTKAQRVASRAVHRLGSDGAVATAAGFRRTAKADRALHRLAQREDVIVSGQALLRIGAFIVVRATSVGELRRAVKDVIQSCEESGLRVERGIGVQALWYCFQLPGGPGW